MRKELAAVITEAQRHGLDSDEMAQVVISFLEHGLDMDLAGNGWFEDDTTMTTTLDDDLKITEHLKLIQSGLESQSMSLPEWVLTKEAIE